MTNIYTLRPGIACLVYVTKNAVLRWQSSARRG